MIFKSSNRVTGFLIVYNFALHCRCVPFDFRRCCGAGFLSKFPWRGSNDDGEAGGEMRSVGKAEDSADMLDGDVALRQHDFGFIDAPVGDVLPHRKSGLSTSHRLWPAPKRSTPCPTEEVS